MDLHCCLTKRGVFIASADGASWAVVNEEISSCRARWEVMEVEEKSSPVAFTIQMEVAETVETVRIDQA